MKTHLLFIYLFFVFGDLLCARDLELTSPVFRNGLIFLLVENSEMRKKKKNLFFTYVIYLYLPPHPYSLKKKNRFFDGSDIIIGACLQP